MPQMQHSSQCQLHLFPSYARTIASKITVTPKGVYLPISKMHSILAVANLLAHNNKSQICFVNAVKFHYRVLQLTAVFLTIFRGNIYFAGDGTHKSMLATSLDGRWLVTSKRMARLCQRWARI